MGCIFRLFVLWNRVRVCRTARHTPTQKYYDRLFLLRIGHPRRPRGRSWGGRETGANGGPFSSPLTLRRRFPLAPVSRPPHDLPLGLRGCALVSNSRDNYAVPYGTDTQHTPLRVGAFTGLHWIGYRRTYICMVPWYVVNKQAVVSHLSLPDASQATVHSVGMPQEVEDPQIQSGSYILV